METFDLIEKFALTKLSKEKNQTIDNYSLNGSILRINYSFQHEWSNDRMDRSYEIFEVNILDYITFVFNSK